MSQRWPQSHAIRAQESAIVWTYNNIAVLMTRNMTTVLHYCYISTIDWHAILDLPNIEHIPIDIFLHVRINQ